MARQEISESLKRCAKCALVKPESEFHRRKNKRHSYCRVCIGAYKRSHYLRNRERVLAVNKTWAERNPENIKRRSAAWYAENTARHKALTSARHARHREEINAAHRDWYAQNKEARALSVKAWRQEHPEIVKSIRKRYVENNPDKILARGVLAQAYRGRAAPKWLTAEHKAQIRKFYAIARWAMEETGEAYHVDHIVPIRGKHVCGLHVPWNLQVLSASENQRKSNLFEG